MSYPLRDVRLFQSFSDAERSELLRFMRERRFAQGETVCTCGDHGSTMLLVTQGALAAVVAGADGETRVIADLPAGNVFGEMFCIDPAPRPVTLVASVPSQVLELGREDLIAMRQVAPRAVAALIGAVFVDVLKRLRNVEDRIGRELEADGGSDGSGGPGGRGGLPVSWQHCFAGLRGSA